MTVDGINVDTTLKEVEDLLCKDQELSPTLRSMLSILVVIIKLLVGRIHVTSRNSSKPPSSDPNRPKIPRKKTGKKPGGQKGHIGTTLQKIPDPDHITVLPVDRSQLPEGEYREAGFETRQVFDIDISRTVTEYQAQVLCNAQGQRFVAPFPEGVSKAVQYGNTLKAHAVYLSQYQLLPYQRIQEYFAEQLQIPVSQGSLFRFNQQAYTLLAEYESISKDRLAAATRMHADETGINIGGSRRWLHCASNNLWTCFAPHEKRGKEAMDEIGILPRFTGVLCHDHWKPYYRYRLCRHALCNAHHLRELTRAHEQENQVWALTMKKLLEAINKAVHEAGGVLNQSDVDHYRQRYRTVLEQAQIECPPPKETRRKGQRGRIKRSKARNLLERLLNYEQDVLRFMEHPEVPFTNNQGENDIRMTKVQQKISGCFRSMEGALIFCRVRGYLSSCKKHGVSSSQAMRWLFEKKLPDFAR